MCSNSGINFDLTLLITICHSLHACEINSNEGTRLEGWSLEIWGPSLACSELLGSEGRK